jgi:protein gp37
MCDRTPIEWTQTTWNPVRGCTRVSPGCGGPGKEGGCYARGGGSFLVPIGDLNSQLADTRRASTRSAATATSSSTSPTISSSSSRATRSLSNS